MLPPTRFLPTSHSRVRNGFTLIELISVIAIAVILVVLLGVPARRLMEKSKEAKSLGNLRTIGGALSLFAAENGGRLPQASSIDYKAPFWSDSIAPYLPEPKKDAWISVKGTPYTQSPALVCPFLENGKHIVYGDYGCNFDVMKLGEGLPVSRIARPSRLVMVAAAEFNEAASWYILTSDYISMGDASPRSKPSDRGTGKVLSLFADGHTEAVPKEFMNENRRDYFLANP